MIETWLAALTRLDPSGWDTGLSPENARASWAAALSAISRPALRRPLPGRPPRAVLIVASRNVFTAPLEWLFQLRARGVRVLLKPARGQEAACRAMAEVLSAELRSWRGGDLAAEAAALAEVDGVIAFGRAETLAALRARVPPGVVFLGFGPRFGVSVVDRVDEATVLDHVLYDGRGCMSPAAVFAREADLDRVGAILARFEQELPRGPLDPAEAVGFRARVLLARAVGRVIEGPAWAAMELPRAHFSPVALPRLVVIHPWAELDEVRATLAPFAAELGTVAGADLGWPLRSCRPGHMQLPEMDRLHDGVDVLEALWR